MKADTVCLRCHQKCHLTAEVIDGKIVSIEDASINRTPPCSEACPIGMDVPGYVMAASQGKLNQAMEIIRDTNPFPLVCGRVCHHPCELECNRNALDEPIAIQWIKRMIADNALKDGELPQPAKRTREETVAIIGAGPAGLTAAHDLVKAGYGVTVYEAGPVAGGLLSQIIPDFKLPREMVQTDIDYIQALGVEIKTNTPVGDAEQITIDKLLDTNDAVLVATGCWKSLSVDIHNTDLEGVYQDLDLLKDVKQGKRLSLTGRVIVIGGGNTAMDVARVAKRLGVQEVHLTCLEHRDVMPAHPWEIEHAEREGVTIHPALAPDRFVGNGNNRIARIDFSRVASVTVDAQGTLTWSLEDGPDSKLSMEANAVIIAIGQCPSLSCIGGACQPTTTSRGLLAIDPETLATDVPRLYAAGDVVVGAGSVVGSIATGRKAASSIIKYLGGIEPKRPAAKKDVLLHYMVEKHRQRMPTLAPTKAVGSFQEVELGYSEQTGIKEARRCINCVTVCPKGLTIPDVMYHPERLLYPLKRAGKRGEVKWERISWDEALDTIASKLKEIKERYGPEAIHVSCGSGQKHIGGQAMVIARELWPTPNTHWGRYTCIVPDSVSNRVTLGDMITYEYGPDYEHSKCLVFWGAEPDIGTPAQARDAHRALRNGAKLIVIDPRPIPMAKRADIWLRIRPGTDMALALAMAHVIINEGIYDKEFVEKWCVGFGKVKEHVQKYPPEWAAKMTGLSKEDIVNVARMYATNKPGCVYIRLGAGSQQVTSTQTARAINILVGICGNIDVPGGNLLYNRTFHDALFWHTYDMEFGLKGPAAVEAKRIGAKEYPLMHKSAECDIPGTVRAMEDGKIKALWCVSDNLIVAEMDSRRIWELMKNKLDFIFVSDFFMTPTAELADIVLPAAFYQEIDNVVAAFMYPANYVTATRRLVEPLDECKDDREVAIEIAKRMGEDVAPWGSVKEFLNWRLKYTGLTFDELCQRPDSRITFPREFRRYERSTPPFITPSGKVELYSSVLEALGLDPLPVYEEPPDGPLSTPELFKEYPLIYTHYRLYCYMHAEGRQIERQRQLTPYPYLEINSDTASKLGIKDGEWVYLETPQSTGKWRLSFKARLVPEMHPDVVAGPHAWWFPEKPGPEHGCFDSNINAILPLDPPYDPVVGNVQCRALLCRVGKAES